MKALRAAIKLGSVKIGDEQMSSSEFDPGPFVISAPNVGIAEELNVVQFIGP